MEEDIDKKNSFFNKYKKTILWVLLFFLSILFVLWWYFIFDKYKQNQANNLSNIIKNTSINNCKIILDQNSEDIRKNKYIDYEKFVLTKSLCSSKYDFREIDLNLDNCSSIIKANSSSDFDKKYLYLDNFSQIQKKCFNDYFKINLSDTKFFNPENDFKSELSFDFNLDFYTDLDELEVWKNKFLENRVNAKNKFLENFSINPKVNIDLDDIVLYPKKAIISLNLLSKKEYKIKFLNWKILWEKIIKKVDNKKNVEEEENWKKIVNNNELKKGFIEEQTYLEDIKIITPEKKYLWLKLNNPVSLYTENSKANFSIIDYNTNKKKVWVKICRVDNEIYSKLDILIWRAKVDKSLKELFVKGLDTLKNFECKTKDINLREEVNDKNIFVNKTFYLSDLLWNPAKSWLYFISFSDSNDRNYNWNLQKPILFWIINSHVTLKLSKNWEAFFFVNDFDWNPLANQNIRLYINEFKAQEEKYNGEERKEYIKYYSPFVHNVLGNAIVLWKTWKDWVLKVNLKWIVDNYFDKTNQNYDYKYSWIDDSFFITSASNTNLSYLKSTWNSWISPENFWYKIWSWWTNSNAWDDIILNPWSEEEWKYYSHTYTDRVLYLPWEEVNIKSIIRESKKLKIPENIEFKIVVKDSKNKEIFSKNLKANSFWSIYTKLKLDNSSPLWYYSIILKDKDNNQLWVSTFSVEVFKKPKFKTNIVLNTKWLDAWYAKITDKKIEKHKYYDETFYLWKFDLNASISSKYYNGTNLKNAKVKYKIYKQPYYENDWWNNCYYGCYYTPKKELYTSWESVLNENWNLNIDVPIDFESSYDDYKYIFEVTVTDAMGDRISSSNSIIVKLDKTKKRWNDNFSLKFKTDKKFYKIWENIKIKWELNWWDWTKYFDDKYIFIIKKKEYKTTYVDDVKWYKRPITNYNEVVKKIILINSKNFKLVNWKLELNYKIPETWEYIFEYGQLNDRLLFDDLPKVIKNFTEKDKLKLEVNEKIYVTDTQIQKIQNLCIWWDKDCSLEKIKKDLWCKLDDYYKNITKTTWDNRVLNKYNDKDNCYYKEKFIKYKREVLPSELIKRSSKQYFSILVYWNLDAKNPIVDDNKIKVYTEKFSYKLWEKAKILVRLPFSKWKILLTIEKQWVIKKEYFDINSNIFFKEILVDDTFVPNAYIWVLAIETPEDKTKTPEYKVWYSEIIVDKTDKKSFIDIKTDKKTYAPREKVNMTFKVKDKFWKDAPSELSVMVIDDSLISLMWNVDLNLLEKFYKKLPFSIQTSITNLAMLKNYYFARPWIVWWSWFWNFKWWDSAVSTRSIFKNTAYYNPSVITNEKGEADINFELPDNLTNFRIIVVSNSKNNLFWESEKFIEVRKDVLVEPKVPSIIRIWDNLNIWANIFNNTNKSIWFKVVLNSNALNIKNLEKTIEIWASDFNFVNFKLENNNENIENIDYTISILWNSKENSDKIKWNIKLKKSPILIQNIFGSKVVEKNNSKTITIKVPKNTDFKKSKVKISVSNNRLIWIKNLVSTLVKYPYWCVEQTASSTLPNAIIKEFINYFPNLSKLSEKSENNLKNWIDRLKSMQQKSGWFVYWQGDSVVNDHITPYVVRTLIDMKNFWVKVPQNMIDNWILYLNSIYNKSDDSLKSEILWTFAKSWKIIWAWLDSTKLNRHQLIAYTYWLILSDKVRNKKIIDENIKLIKEKIDNISNYYYYWNSNSDKAIFASMLMDYDYDFSYIDYLISDLYWKDWSSYYYSTQEKNNSFMAFIKFMKKYSSSKNNNFWYSIWTQLNRWHVFTLWKINNNFYNKEFNLSDVAYDWKIDFTVANLSWDRIYMDINLEHYPKDIEKVEPYSNKMKIQRNIFEVIDESSMEKCEQLKNSYYDTEKKKASSYCLNAYKKHKWNIFDKSKLYKVELEVKFENDNARRNLTIEDYLPSSFSVLNSKFNTNSISTNQNSTNNSRRWNHIEINPDVVFVTSDYVYWDTIKFNYFFIPEFTWKFIYPPETAYLMYNPIIRANWIFRKITVK